MLLFTSTLEEIGQLAQLAIFTDTITAKDTGTTTAQTSNSGVSTLFDASFYVLTDASKCL